MFLGIDTWKRSFSWELMWGNNHESFRKGFMSRDSILLWCITHWRAHHRRMRAALAEHADGTEVVVLRSPRAVRAWLADVARLDPSRQAAIH